MKKYIIWEELTSKQLDAITWFRLNPPKYYKWFYKLYKKYLSMIIFILFIVEFILAILHNIINYDFFNIIKIIGFVLFGIGLWALSAFLYKHFYTKKYVKKIGLTLKNWNYLTKGMTWDI